MEGFCVLAERSRCPEDKQFIKKTIETTLKCKIDEHAFYNQYFKEHNLGHVFESMSSSLGIPQLIVS